MNPFDYLDSLSSQIKEQVEMCDKNNPNPLDAKIFTQRDYLNRIQGFINSMRSIVDKSYFKIIGAQYNGKEIEVEGMKCKHTEIEELILIQPLSIMSEAELNDLMQAVMRSNDKGAFNNKMVMVVPYDVCFLKAKISNE